MAKTTEDTPCPHARRFDLCQDHIAAIVLERLTWWWRRGTRVIHGVEWRVKPREQLAEETRLSDKQVRAALEKLKARNLIETSQHKWMGQNYMHYRLLPRAMILINGTGLDEPISEAILTPQNQEPELALQGTLQDHMAGMDTKLPLTPSNEGVQGNLVAGASLGGFASSGFSDQGNSVKEPTKMLTSKSQKGISPQSPPKLPKAAMSAAEIIAAKSKTGVWPGKTAGKPKKQSLGDIWLQATGAA